MKPLAAHKKLLIAESELNRTILVNDCQQFRAGINAYIDHAKSLGGMFSVAKLLSAGFMALKGSKPDSEAPKPKSWVGSIITGAMKATELWQSFRSRARQHQD